LLLRHADALLLLMPALLPCCCCCLIYDARCYADAARFACWLIAAAATARLLMPLLRLRYYMLAATIFVAIWFRYYA